MKKYTLELSEEQLTLVARCLEDISRFASGQTELRYTTEEMVRGLGHEESSIRLDAAQAYLRGVKTALFPQLSTNGYLSYNGTEFIGNVYQIYRTIRYKLNQDNNVQDVWSSPPLASGNLGRVKITKVEKLNIDEGAE
jgi:hypothetical protein